MGRIVTIVLIIVLIVGGVWWWRNYHDANLYDGSVVRRDAAMETGTTTMENGQNIGEVHATPSRSDAPGTVNGEPYRGDSEDVGIQTTPITQDPYGKGGPYAASGSYGSTGSYAPVPPPNGQWPPSRRGAQQPPQVIYGPGNPSYSTTMTDSQAPNAPDGLRFGGDGNYQWYRQGNLTYRVNTRTGSSCVAYATMEEWRNRDVRQHACRGR